MSLMDDISSGESDRLEFKEIPNDNSDRWIKTAVAFANCRGGRILFGVSNSRTVKGLDGNLFAMRDSISDAVASSCSPPLPAQVSITTVGGKPIIVLARGRSSRSCHRRLAKCCSRYYLPPSGGDWRKG